MDTHTDNHEPSSYSQHNAINTVKQDVPSTNSDAHASPATKTTNGLQHDAAHAVKPMSAQAGQQPSVDVVQAAQRIRTSHEGLEHSEPAAQQSSSSSNLINRIKSTAGSVSHRVRQKLANHGTRRDGSLGSSEEEETFEHVASHNTARTDLSDHSIPRKPVASELTPTSSVENAHNTTGNNARTLDSQRVANNHDLPEQTKKHLSSVGIDLDNTTETLQNTHIAEPVTHEEVKPEEIEVQTKKITRDIHDTDVFYRIQPIKEQVILPSRHFVRTLSGTLNEVPESGVQAAIDMNMRQLAEQMRAREMAARPEPEMLEQREMDTHTPRETRL